MLVGRARSSVSCRTFLSSLLIVLLSTAECNPSAKRALSALLMKSDAAAFNVGTGLSPVQPRVLSPSLRAGAPSMQDVKESTWDRLTGPKLFKSVTKTEGIHSVPLVP